MSRYILEKKKFFLIKYIKNHQNIPLVRTTQLDARYVINVFGLTIWKHIIRLNMYICRSSNVLFSMMRKQIMLYVSNINVTTFHYEKNIQTWLQGGRVSVFGVKSLNRVDVRNFHECYPLFNIHNIHIINVLKFGNKLCQRSEPESTYLVVKLSDNELRALVNVGINHDGQPHILAIVHDRERYTNVANRRMNDNHLPHILTAEEDRAQTGVARAHRGRQKGALVDQTPHQIRRQPIRQRLEHKAHEEVDKEELARLFHLVHDGAGLPQAGHDSFRVARRLDRAQRREVLQLDGMLVA